MTCGRLVPGAAAAPSTEHIISQTCNVSRGIMLTLGRQPLLAELRFDGIGVSCCL